MNQGAPLNMLVLFHALEKRITTPEIITFLEW